MAGRHRKYADDRETNRVMSREYRAREKAKRESYFANRARVVPLSSGEAIALYRLEKAKSDERNAPKRAEERAAVERAIAKADDEAIARGRGGRPKAKHGPSIFIPSRDRLDLLRESRPGGTP